LEVAAKFVGLSSSYARHGSCLTNYDCLIMRNFLLSTLPLLACVIAAVLGMDIMDEVAGEWKMGLRPRQARSSLQPFTEALGGASAAPVSATRPHTYEWTETLTVMADYELGEHGQAIPG
jgi:hypothetical protein